jgi:outer membrane receptor protein involved in Fe transport
MQTVSKAVLMAGVFNVFCCSAWAQSAPDREVVIVTTLPGSETSLRAIPAPVQTLDSHAISDSHALDLTQLMNRTLGSVYINDVQNNPLQPDLNFRGFTASPLLGAPQGLSVYLDGQRLNQAFGDVVSWDLIPREAISSVTLAPGSNPLFGLNTLGGAVAIETRDGLSDPGSTVEAGYGSNARYQVTAATGGSSGALDWYLTANTFSDDGWRDFSPTEASQLFGKLGWSRQATRATLSIALADTDLTGNGLQEQRFLDRDYASVYTKPDETRNKSGLGNVSITHDVSDHLKLSGALYYRQIGTRTLNGDINDESLTENVYQPSASERAALAIGGYTGFLVSGETAANTPFPKWRCIANILLNDEPNEKCNGLLNRSQTSQNDAGAAGQATFSAPVGARANAFTIGAAVTENSAHFRQSTQFGYLTPERGVAIAEGPGAFADGTQDSENAFDARVDLSGRTRVWSIYATDTLALTPEVTLTVSGRYDSSRIENRDAITLSGPGSLTADHSFERFNPALGLTWTPGDALTAYAGYSEGSRAPSAIELGCSDPANPCRLPNALAGDPPLEQVVTRTTELGARGRAGSLGWRAGVFKAVSSDDILFVADDSSGFGYFRNFGRTRRQGVELGATGDFGPVNISANYTLLDATYRSAEDVPGNGNSTNEEGPGFEGSIGIEKGDRIVLTPRQIFKLDAIWTVMRSFTLNANVVAQDGVYARGNENNDHEADGAFYLGPGKTDGFAVLNLGGEWRPTPHMKLFLQVNNALDERYATAAQLGATGFNGAGDFIARPFAGPIVDGERPVLGATFFAPAAPRLIWGGVRLTF